MKHLTDFSRILFSISIIALSASIAYFTFEISRVRSDLPELLTQLNETAKMIEPVTKQIENINKLVPPILEEVKQSRELIPPIIKEVKEVRKEIPAILHEVEQTRKIIPPVLKEVKATRESLPGLITDANKLVDKARSAGKEASSGAVTGFFSGIFRAPFAIVGDIGSTVFGMDQKEKEQYSQEDLNRVYQAALELLNSDIINTKKEITSQDGSIKTTITLTKIDTTGEYLCKSMHFHSVKGKKVISDKDSTVCKNEEGKWDNNK